MRSRCNYMALWPVKYRFGRSKKGSNSGYPQKSPYLSTLKSPKSGVFWAFRVPLKSGYSRILAYLGSRKGHKNDRKGVKIDHFRPSKWPKWVKSGKSLDLRFWGTLKNRYFRSTADPENTELSKSATCLYSRLRNADLVLRRTGWSEGLRKGPKRGLLPFRTTFKDSKSGRFWPRNDPIYQIWSDLVRFGQNPVFWRLGPWKWPILDLFGTHYSPNGGNMDL